MDEALKRLARWRRQGRGIWRISYIVEGFDDEFVLVYPGKYSRRAAVYMGKVELARSLDCKRKHVHLKTANRET